MLRITIGFILWLVLAVSATDGFAQCINGDPFASATADNSINTAVTISTSNYQIEYSTIDGILAGNTYQLGYDLGGCITISTSPLGPEVAWGTSPLTWVASTSGTIYVHYNTNCNSCGTASISNSFNCDICLSEASITATPPPTNGFYQNGTSVDFCYNIDALTEQIGHLCRHQQNITNILVKLDWVQSDSTEFKRAVESGWMNSTMDFLNRETNERELQVDKYNLRSEFGFPETSSQPTDYENNVRLWTDKYCDLNSIEK